MLTGSVEVSDRNGLKRLARKNPYLVEYRSGVARLKGLGKL